MLSDPVAAAGEGRRDDERSLSSPGMPGSKPQRKDELEHEVVDDPLQGGQHQGKFQLRLRSGQSWHILRTFVSDHPAIGDPESSRISQSKTFARSGRFFAEVGR